MLIFLMISSIRHSSDPSIPKKREKCHCVKKSGIKKEIFVNFTRSMLILTSDSSQSEHRLIQNSAASRRNPIHFDPDSAASGRFYLVPSVSGSATVDCISFVSFRIGMMHLWPGIHVILAVSKTCGSRQNMSGHPIYWFITGKYCVKTRLKIYSFFS